MANHKSAKKRIRTNAKRREINRSYISTVRTAVKKFKAAAVTEANKESILKIFTSAQSYLAKASAKGLIHKNRAARTTSRLASLLKRFESGENQEPAK